MIRMRARYQLAALQIRVQVPTLGGVSASIDITLGHSPDPDDAFMWWPLFGVDGGAPAIGEPGLRFVQVCDDIETLNRRSAGPVEALLDVTAMSCANLPMVGDRYALTACGSSVGDGYGPKLVARTPMTFDQLRDPSCVIAVPGRRTTSFLALSLMLGPGSFRFEEVPFDELMERVADGTYRAGVVIHEGQLLFGQHGLHLVQDLGAWWNGHSGLPLPLGVNAVRRDLDARHGAGTQRRVNRLLMASIEHAMAHREQGVAYALRFARGMEASLAGTFVDMYVNRWTLDCGPRGREAVDRLLSEAAAAGLSPPAPREVFVSA
jgi:1,4-dihydroxy-6-naphthoate synthase